MFQQPFNNGSDSPALPPLPPIKRGRGRPPKNRALIAQREAEARAKMLAAQQQQLLQLQQGQSGQSGQQLPQQQVQPTTPAAVPQAKQTPQRAPRHSQLDKSPRPRPPPTPVYQNGASPYQPQPQYMHPGSADQGLLYAPPQNFYAMPPPPPAGTHPIPAFPVIPAFQHQQQEQQQQNQNNVRLQQQQQSSKTSASSEASNTTAPDGVIMTPAGGSIGAGLGQAVGNAGASPASRTRKRTDFTEPDLKVPEQGDLGWMPEAISPDEAHAIYTLILSKLRGHKDPSGRLLAAPLENTPDPEIDPDYYVRVEKPTSLAAIEQRVNGREYANAVAFEMDVLQMFENGRRSYPIGSQTYGDIVTLQRLYHHLTKSKSNPLEQVDLKEVAELVNTADASKNFSSIPHGPGFASAGSEGDLTTRISSKMKTYYEHINFKGRAFRVGDWVHLINPSDPSKPIVAQIFKVSRRDDQPGHGWITVCWYFRPEQTYHPPSKKFYKDEVVKTGYFADHQIEDVLEKILVMFYTKFIRGRPKPDYWDPKSPLYITESRYNEQQKVFHKIKSWASCVPEEIRKVETPMDYFEKAISPPPREESPFLRGEVGPGALREEDAPESGDQHEFPELFKDSVDETRPKKRSKDFDAEQQPGMAPYHVPRGTPSEVFTSLATQVATRVTSQDYQKLQQMLSGPGAATLDMVQIGKSLGGVNPNLLNDLRNAAFAAGVAQAVAGPGEKAQVTNLVNAMQAQKGEGFFSELPSEAQSLFSDQPSGQVTWYPAPPLDGPTQHEYAQKGFWNPQGLANSHTLDYLYDQVLRNGSNKSADQQNGVQSSKAFLTGASGLSDMLGSAGLASKDSPSIGTSTLAGSTDAGSSSTATSAEEAFTPLVSQNGWSVEWGEDPQRTADALADFAGQIDSSQLNLASFLSSD